ncbi:MAG: hypothetical protein MAG431_00851 [Chloroflexi bacterium]|nr:hypothetical protein [Chloroflexota bacterium]
MSKLCKRGDSHWQSSIAAIVDCLEVTVTSLSPAHLLEMNLFRQVDIWALDELFFQFIIRPLVKLLDVFQALLDRLSWQEV